MMLKRWLAAALLAIAIVLSVGVQQLRAEFCIVVVSLQRHASG